MRIKKILALGLAMAVSMACPAAAYGASATGWTEIDGTWYYFNYRGEMYQGGWKTVDNQLYYFYEDGAMAAGCYVGPDYIGIDGLKDDTYSMEIQGRGNLTAEQKQEITDAAALIPAAWIQDFLGNGWRFQYYIRSQYFGEREIAPGTYSYIHHKTDTDHHLIKITSGQGLLEAFGEYIGYQLDYYGSKNQEFQNALKLNQDALQEFLQIPAADAQDVQTYFGKMTKVYLEKGNWEELHALSPECCAIIEAAIHSR